METETKGKTKEFIDIFFQAVNISDKDLVKEIDSLELTEPEFKACMAVVMRRIITFLCINRYMVNCTDGWCIEENAFTPEEARKQINERGFKTVQNVHAQKSNLFNILNLRGVNE